MTTTTTMLKKAREHAEEVPFDELVDAADVHIDPDLPPDERMRDYVRQIRNPYHYRVGDVEVRVKFAGEASLQECLEHYLEHDARVAGIKAFEPETLDVA